MALDLESFLTIVGTLIAIWGALATKQLWSPKLSVKVGLCDYAAIPKAWQARNVDAIAVGVSALEARKIVLPLFIRLYNRGRIPVTDVHVVLDFPGEALIDKPVVVGPIAGESAVFDGLVPAEDREVSRFLGMAQCRIPIGLVRPGETYITGEMIQLQAGLLATVESTGATDKAETLRQRYSSCEQLRSSLEVQISVWSSSMRPILLSVTMIWLAVKNPDEIAKALAQMARLSAAESPLKPGLYFLPRPWKRPDRHELVEIHMITAKDFDALKRALTPEGVVANSKGLTALRVPPWGFWGESFDIRTKWKAKLLRPYKRRE